MIYTNYIKLEENQNKAFIIISVRDGKRYIYGFINKDNIEDIERTVEYALEDVTEVEAIKTIEKALDTSDTIVIELANNKREFTIITKVCKTCGIEKNILDFQPQSNKKHFMLHCSKCFYKEVANNRRIKRRKIKINLLKRRGNKCANPNCDLKCNDNNTYLFEFHHTNPETKLFEITSNKVYTMQELEKEADKCIILCKNCHAEYHYNEHNDIKNFL